MQLTEQQYKLLEFVKEAHGDQKRKYTGQPYWHHVLAVANIVDDFCHFEEGLIEVALCHDLFEDTKCNRIVLSIKLEELEYTPLQRLFIVSGVEALTDVFTPQYRPDWNRSFRKQWECERLGKINKSYQNVKYADLIHNTQSIVEHDKEFATKYLSEKRAILEVMRMGNMDLLIECYNTLIKAEELLNEQ